MTSRLRRVLGAAYAYHSFSSETLANITYTDCDFDHANFASATLKNVTFDHCNLNHALFPIYIDDLTFTNSTLANADFTEAMFRSVHFEPGNTDALLRGARALAGTAVWLPALYHLTPGTNRIPIDEPHRAGTLGIDIRRPAYIDYDFDAIANTVGDRGLAPRAISLAKEHPRLSAASLAALLRATVRAPTQPLLRHQACAPAAFRDILKV
jgi:hypothetical protein